jgi:hypothetical protein
MTKNFEKVVRPCKTECGWTYCKIKFIDGNLSITGVEGPLPNGNCIGGCGQIIMSGWGIREYGNGWDKDSVADFRQVWDRWHLNDMRAGTPKQEEYIRDNISKYDYVAVCSALKEAGLLVDDGYKYGSKWLKEEVPEDVIEWLMALPDSPTKPAWV